MSFISSYSAISTAISILNQSLNNANTKPEHKVSAHALEFLKYHPQVINGCQEVYEESYTSISLSPPLHMR